MKEKKKVLIITYYWPPSGGAGVQRWLKFAKYLPEFDIEPVIYTAENPEAPSLDFSLLKDIPKNIEILKHPIWEPYMLYKKFTGKSKKDNINAGFLSEKKTNPLLEKISIFIRGNFFIPDARKFWIRPSVKFLKNYLSENPVDIIISTGPPHSMHLIALEIKKTLNIKWIADFRDPWTNIDFYKKLRLTKRSDKKHKFLERNVLKTADIVVSVSKTWGEEYKNMGAKKVEIITNGFDSDDLPKSKPKPYTDFSIIHTGALNKDRNHIIFWKAIKEMIQGDKEFEKKIKIKFVGKLDNSVYRIVKEYNLSKYFEHIPNISHDEIINELMKAHVLYLPINNTPNAKGIIPGKIFEYIAAQKPVLAIGRTDGDIGEIINETKSGEIYGFNDLKGVKEFLETNFYKFQDKGYNYLSIDIRKFTRRYLTQKLVKLINTL